MASILITGSGMLACALLRMAHAHGHSPVAFPHTQLDICDRDAVRQAINTHRPNVIFHTAAMTRVNFCEQHPDLARRVNTGGTRNVVEAADATMAKVIYFSTDYVFDGAQQWPFQEDAQPNPLNIYGATKLAGEHLVLNYFRGHVVRTSGVFGARDNGTPERNFFRAITQQLYANADLIHVVNDQTTAVTYAAHLAAMVLGLMDESMPKLVHLTSSGTDTWYGWAKLVVHALGGDEARLKPVPASEYEDQVQRPTYSVLGSMLTQAKGAMAMHPARPAVEAYVKEVALKLAQR